MAGREPTLQTIPWESTYRLEHRTANKGDYRQPDRADVVDQVTRDVRTADRGHGVRSQSPRHCVVRTIRGCWRRSHIRTARGAHRREAEAASPWFIGGCDPGDFPNPPDGPWVIAALLPDLPFFQRQASASENLECHAAFAEVSVAYKGYPKDGGHDQR